MNRSKYDEIDFEKIALHFHEVFIVLNKIFSKEQRSLFTVKAFLRE
jgi:hypothetical protein